MPHLCLYSHPTPPPGQANQHPESRAGVRVLPHPVGLEEFGPLGVRGPIAGVVVRAIKRVALP